MYIGQVHGGTMVYLYPNILILNGSLFSSNKDPFNVRAEISNLKKNKVHLVTWINKK